MPKESNGTNGKTLIITILSGVVAILISAAIAHYATAWSYDGALRDMEVKQQVDHDLLIETCSDIKNLKEDTRELKKKIDVIYEKVISKQGGTP